MTDKENRFQRMSYFVEANYKKLKDALSTKEKIKDSCKYLYKKVERVLILLVCLLSAFMLIQVISVKKIEIIEKLEKAHTYLAILLVWSPILGSFLLLICKIRTQFRIINDLASSIKIMSPMFKRLNDSTLSILNNTSGILKDLMHLNIREELMSKQGSVISEGLHAVKLNCKTWSDSVNGANDDVIQTTWLNYLKTYFREESFDIQRREIVTNARNYPFLLITTLVSFAKTIEEQKDAKVYFYTVTPVHPKDWYNWPHGRVKPRCYYEIPFLGQYRRILREIKKWDKNKKIEHGRFLLVADDVTVAETLRRQYYGWEIDPYSKVIGSRSRDDDIHLKNWYILDVPATLNIFDSYPNIHKIYSFLVEDQENRVFTPLLCNKVKVYKDVIDKIKHCTPPRTVDEVALEAEIHAIINKDDLISDVPPIYNVEIKGFIERISKKDTSTESYEVIKKL